jgi:hypothetical protein
MHFKIDFVTNSSSTAFMITNRSATPKDLVDFAKENIHLFYEFLEQYDWNKNDPLYTEENFIASAALNNIQWKPNETLECVFGDEQGTMVGAVYDYILREGGKSENFYWRFHEYHR